MENKQQDFKLEVVLTAITDINLVDDFNEIFELYKFVFMDPLISTTSLNILKRSMTIHLLEIHPELESAKYEPKIDGDIDKWLAIQKAEFGDKLPICVVGHTLNKKGKEKIKTIDYYEE